MNNMIRATKARNTFMPIGGVFSFAVLILTFIFCLYNRFSLEENIIVTPQAHTLGYVSIALSVLFLVLFLCIHKLPSLRRQLIFMSLMLLLLCVCAACMLWLWPDYRAASTQCIQILRC